jgi:predicted PurR-regulated permease PerM
VVRSLVERGIEYGVSKRDSEVAARGAPLATPEPVVVTTPQAVARTHRTVVTRQIRGEFPRSRADDALALVRIFSRVFGSYTRGVIVESIIVGVISALAYYLIGVQVWLPLGVIAFFGEIVPIIGPWIALFISLPVILATQPDKTVLVLGLFVVIQILEGLFLAPRIQGGSVNLTPAAALIALVIGGVIGGPLGAILALPAVALMREIALYTSFRAGGLSPAEAMSRLPLFRRAHQGDRAVG